ncbi:MAG: DMT family transporter, partial [Burkholderiales bacterium]|nr:DMT family transporter [Burkholderiales bacterium]
MTASAATADRRVRGWALLLGATLCWASAGVLVRTQSVTAPWEITFWRSSVMVVFLALVMAWPRWRDRTRPGAIAQVHAAGVPGVLSGLLLATMCVCFIVALSLSTVADTLVLTSLSPFTSALAVWLLLRERVAWRTWLAIAAAAAGVAAIFADGLGRGSVVGQGLALVVPLCYGLNVALLRRMHAHVDMVPGVFLGGVFSALVAWPFAMPFTAQPADFVNLALLGVVQLGLGCVLMVRASRHLSGAELGFAAP